MFHRGMNAYTAYQIANYNAYLAHKSQKNRRKHAEQYSINRQKQQQIVSQQMQTILENTGAEKIEMEKQTMEIIDMEMRKIYTLFGMSRLKYLHSKKFMKEFREEHNYSLSVILLDGYIVKKTMKNTRMGHHMLNNEIQSLSKLVSYKHFPKLYGYDGLSIYMSYCGEKITSSNIPDDWKEQIIEIKDVLNKVNVNPDDMIQRNVCVLNGIINIIDFGLNTQFTAPVNESINKLYRLLENLHKKKYVYKTTTNNTIQQNKTLYKNI